ncbi:uncharacterized protein LOC128214030 [Mya arenaria]|uniref:uncharacterized protein LOC128214030 n=1 Tax=Mya arenaria TaxID=6604 RepID=UPI0022E56CCE|nr:uncharacterized protein LOC128214030 [Mya arenaria]
MTYQCEVCNVTFSKLSQLLQHRRTENHWPKFTCPSCKKSFTRKNNLKQHMKKHEDENNHHCPECLRVFTRRDALDEHFKQHENQSGGGRKRSSGDDADSNATNKKQKLSAKDDVKDYYRVDKISERRIEKFNSTASYYKISVKDMEIRELPNIIKTLKQIFQSIIDTIAGNIPSSDRVRVTMDNPQLDFPIVLRFMKRSELTVDRLLSEIERVLQSYEQFVLDETFGLEFVHVHLPNGSGTRGKPFVDISKLLNNKASVLQIRNTDELCCARAIVTAIARIEKHPQWNNIRLGHHAQKQLALNLHDKAGVPLQRCGIDEVKLFQSALPDYKIVVLSKDHFNAIIYEGQEDGIPIYLYSHNEHFDVITSVAGFLNRSYFCLKCKKGYSNKEQHACNNPCVHCHRIHDDDSFNWEHCIDCNRNFMNETCFAMHKQNHDVGTSTCSMYYKCKDCGQAINVRKHKKAHVCNEKYCKTCKEFVEEDHQCFMQPTEESESERETVKKKTNDTKYIFFDFECTQDQQLQCENGYLSGVHGKCVNCNKATCGSYKHQPNLCVAQRVCRHCLKNDLSSESECEYCGRNELIFKGEQTTQQFCKWLFSEENVGATVICHNFKGYDSYPILQYLHENAILPEVITNGTKFMSIKVPVCKMRFIDSINFIPMALADMPKAFGIAELSKGYFPHLYNRQENQTQTLTSLPDSKYYYPDGMKIDKRLEFIAWYDIHKNDAFDFQYELLKYCRSDVDILRKCCLKFRELFQDITHKNDIPGIDPFEKCLTIASACNLVFRRNFLEHESIGIIPSHGYRPEEKQSVMAYQWMAYLAHEKQINIQHGRNNGEKHIGPYKVDGYYERDGEKVVLEFHGCFWHGCSKCFSSKTVNPVNDMSMGDLNARTIEKKEFIESEGYSYNAKWECDFKNDMEVNLDMKQYIQKLEFVGPLEPRDAFFGGRTEGFKLYEEASSEQEINYYDVTSLYPYVNKTGKIPLGHPEIVTENFQDITHYEGLIKCKILPPRGLYLPVLPVKSNGKLLFSLCRSCADQYQQSPCQHTDSERAFLGTWVTDEVKLAMSQGYKIVEIYEVWHFKDISQYDPDSKCGGIFTEYVNTFLKLKQEASGWPEWCQAEEDEQRYIKQYFEREGIWLDYDKIQRNPGLRSLAKLMLNSFWGKFGQRSNLTRTTYTDDPSVFMDMMTSDQQEVKNIRFVNEEAVQLDWVHGNDFVDDSSRTNVVIAAYTTAQARLKLYSYLQRLGQRCLYCDTDSIIFISRPGQWRPSLGDHLGDMTDEVSGNKITNFVTGGPKNYAYKTESCDKNGYFSICKVKGITLNFKNTLKINYDMVVDMVRGSSASSSVQVQDMKICRDITQTNIITRQETKDYRIVFDKRVIHENYLTYPYGY